MAIQLHEWLDKFIEAHGLDTDIKHTDNISLYVLHEIIHDRTLPTDVYADRYEYVKCMTLNEFNQYQRKPISDDEHPLSDFLYERKTGYVIVNLRYNSSLPHENLMAYLYNTIENKEMVEREAAEKYIDKYGFSLSSVSYHRCIPIGDNFTLTPQEKVIFNAYTFQRL